ncbi:MAG: zinc ribbon domain-containing protein [Gammaproteobacteria bacterium]|nr:MAG: zinc ribbon domain-containing protein [Gammaproteobacteria bacterium]
MPIYEYECEACGNRMEAIQKISDEPLTKCPSCGKENLKKLVSAAAFKLKGGGWYETDFKNKSSCCSGASSPDKKSDTPPACQGCACSTE